MFTLNIFTESCHSITSFDNEAEARDAFQNVAWAIGIAGREGTYCTIGDEHGRRIVDSRKLAGGSDQVHEVEHYGI